MDAEIKESFPPSLLHPREEISRLWREQINRCLRVRNHPGGYLVQYNSKLKTYLANLHDFSILDGNLFVQHISKQVSCKLLPSLQLESCWTRPSLKRVHR
jgi:hypothetical protein